MIRKLQEIWNDKGFEILVISCLIFLCVFGLINFLRKKKGNYSKSKFYVIPSSGKNRNKRKRIDDNSNYPIRNTRRKESKGESECRRVLEKIFRQPFRSVRPDFLRNPVTGSRFNLEIDCYNDKLKLGVEFNGRQHYEYTPYFHRNKEHFLNQKYRDDMKRRICKENGIILIEVPYTIKNKDIESFLVKELKMHNFL